MAQPSFSKEFQAALARRGAASPTAAPKIMLPPVQASNQNDQSPLGWFMDILSRPMRAVENIPNQIFNEMNKAAYDQKTGQNFDWLGAIGNVVTSPIRGLLSTNPNDQPMGADLIEKGTDAFGNLYNPDYVDTKDNVNPWVKGIGGLGLDIGLDPLTYIPVAGWIGKGTQLGLRGAKAAIEGIDAAVAGSNIAKYIGTETRAANKAAAVAREAAAAKASENLAKVRFAYTPTADHEAFTAAYNAAKETTLPIINNASRQMQTEGIKLSEGLAKRAAENQKTIQSRAAELGKFLSSEEGGKLLTKERRAATVAAKKEAEQATLGAQAARIMDSVPAESIKSAPKASAAIVNASDAMPASVADQIRAQESTFSGIASKLDEIVADTPKMPKVSKNYDEWFAGEVAKAKADPNHYLEIVGPAGNHLGRLSAADIIKAKNPKLISEASKATLKSTHEALLAKTSTSKTPASYSEYFQKMLKTKKGQAEVTKLFGETATERLKKMSPNQVDSSIGFLSQVMKNEKDLTDITHMGRVGTDAKFAVDVMRRYGIDIPGTNVRRLQPVSIVDTPEGDAIAEAITRGEDMRTAGYLFGLSQANVDSVSKWLPKALRDFLSTKGYDLEHVTKTGVVLKQDVGAFGTKTIGKRLDEFNSYDQFTMFKYSIEDIARQIHEFNTEMRLLGKKSAVKAGAQRADEIIRTQLREYRLATNTLDKQGVAFFMGVGDTKIRLDFVQMYTALEKIAREGIVEGGNSSELLKMMFFNRGTSVPPTNFFEALVRVHFNPEVTDEELLAVLTQRVKSADGKTMHNGLLMDGGTYRHYLKKPMGGTEPYSLRFEPNLDHPGMYYGAVDSVLYKEEVLALLRSSREEIARIVADNEAMAGERLIAEGNSLSKKKLAELAKLLDDPAGLSEGVRKAANLGDSIAEDGQHYLATVDSQDVAAHVTVGATTADEINAAQRAVGIENAHTKAPVADAKTWQEADAITRERVRKVTEQHFNYNIKVAEQLVDMNKAAEDGFDAFGRIVDHVAHTEAVHELAAARAAGGIFDGFKRFFNINYGAERTVDRYLQSRVHLKAGLDTWVIRLENLRREVGAAGMTTIPGTKTTKLARAFQNVLNGASDPELKALEDSISPLVHEVFGGTSGNQIIPSIFTQAGGTIKDMEAYFKRAGLDFPVDVSLAWDNVKAAEKAGLPLSMMEDALTQMRQVYRNAEDPIEVLYKLYYAGAVMASDKITAGLLMKIGGLWSAKPKAGYVKVASNLNPLDNPFLAHLPEGSFIDPTYLNEIKRVEEISTSARTFNIKFLDEYYTPILNMWKSGVTIYRPGHLFRNFLSSAVMQHVSEGLKFYRKSGSAAMKQLMIHRNYEGVNWMETARAIGESNTSASLRLTEAMPKASDIAFKSQWGDISHGAAYEGANKKGVLVEFRASQDLLSDATSGNNFASRASDWLTSPSNKVGKFAGSANEYQNHFSRLHHFNQILMKNAFNKKFKSFDDLVEYAAKRARTHNPDSTMLAPGEAKLRAVFPFYTWTRLVIPTIVEGIAMHPGRFLMYPKASFAMATSMGLDPTSLADPFPTDQLFPSFLRDQLTGPVAQIMGNYVGINPGNPYIDTLNQFIGAGPVKGIAGMTTPIVRIPMELMGGTQWGTGAKIKDLSDYVDSNLPGINYISNVTGISVTGSLYSFMQANGIDPQYAVNAGTKTPYDQWLSGINWVTGAGLLNMSKQSYINYAEIEKRNKAAQEQSKRSPY